MFDFKNSLGAELKNCKSVETEYKIQNEQNTKSLWANLITINDNRKQ